jgi:type IV secretory pathway TrbF-like protein
MSDTKKGQSTPENPYFEGRREWNERYGGFVQQANTWKLLAFVTLGLMSVAIFGLIYIGSQSKIIPYVVEVDKLGASVAVGKVQNNGLVDENKIIMYSLASMVTNLRTVWIDKRVQKKMLLDAYKYVKQGSTAEKKINEYFTKENPFAYPPNFERSVLIKSVLKGSGNTWEIEWEETVNQNNIATQNSYKALLQVVVVPPTDETQIFANPMGVMITEYTFTKNNTGVNQ